MMLQNRQGCCFEQLWQACFSPLSSHHDWTLGLRLPSGGGTDAAAVYQTLVSVYTQTGDVAFWAQFAGGEIHRGHPLNLSASFWNKLMCIQRHFAQSVFVQLIFVSIGTSSIKVVFLLEGYLHFSECQLGSSVAWVEFWRWIETLTLFFTPCSQLCTSQISGGSPSPWKQILCTGGCRVGGRKVKSCSSRNPHCAVQTI